MTGVRRLPALSRRRNRRRRRHFAGVHRTWLDPHRAAKAPVARPRKALGHVYGRSVRFGGPIAGTLLIGEGIETVLSLVTALPDTIAAAALSAGSLGAFTPPPGVTRLLIARDNDPEGERAAHRLQQRCREYGVAAIVMVSERNDFNDDLAALGPAWVGRPHRAPGRSRRCGFNNKEKQKEWRQEREYSARRDVLFCHTCSLRQPCGSFTPLTLRYGHDSQCHAATRLGPGARATVAQAQAPPGSCLARLH